MKQLKNGVLAPRTPRKKVPSDDPKKPTQVYSRKRNKTKALLSADPSSSDIPNLSTNYITLDDDLDLPIALRKSTHSCVSDTPPIQNFASYHHLSPSFRAFISLISSEPIPTRAWSSITYYVERSYD